MEIRTDRTPKPKRKTKATSKSRKQQTFDELHDIEPSTILTSPLQPPPKRTRKPKQIVQGSDEEEEVVIASDGYARNSFIVDDHENDFFEPPPARHQAPQHTTASNREVGTPIRADATMASLSPMRKIIAEGLQEELFSFCRNEIVAKHKYRKQPFSDTVLRQMSIILPKTIADMMRIPDINADMVTRYGDKLLRLIRNSKQTYKSMKDSSQRPHDPNHEIRIDLTGDPEVEISDDEFDFSDDEFADESSRHFQNNSGSNTYQLGEFDQQQDDRVRKFNSAFVNSQGMDTSTEAQPKTKSRTQSKAPYKGKKTNYKARKGGSGAAGSARKNGGGPKASTKSKGNQSKPAGSGFSAGRTEGGGIRPMA
jgi:hypothetical protein